MKQQRRLLTTTGGADGLLAARFPTAVRFFFGGGGEPKSLRGLGGLFIAARVTAAAVLVAPGRLIAMKRCARVSESELSDSVASLSSSEVSFCSGAEGSTMYPSGVYSGRGGSDSKYQTSSCKTTQDNNNILLVLDY